MRTDSDWKMIIQVEQGLRSISLKARPKTTHAEFLMTELVHTKLEKHVETIFDACGVAT